MKRKTVLIGLLLVAALAAGLGFFWPFGNGEKVLRLAGIVEIQEVRLGSKIGGRVEKVLVRDGDFLGAASTDKLKAGDPLIIFETPELKTQRDQAAARLVAAQAELERAVNGPRAEEKQAAKAAEEAAKARLDRMEKGWREEEKKQAAAELAAAEADLKRTEEDLARVAQLYQQRSAARSEYDAALAARDSALGRANAARAKNLMLHTGNRPEDKAEARAEWQRAKAKFEELDRGTRTEDKDLAKARVAEAKAKLDELDVNLEEGVLRVPRELGRAVVMVVAVRPGDLVAPGQPVIRVLRTEDMWVKAYVPETQLGFIRHKQKVEVTIDSYPHKRFSGTVVFRAPISEFTPRNVQSVDERRHQVFGFKVQLDNGQEIFNAGMAAEVIVPLPKD